MFLVGFLEQQVAGAENVGVGAEVAFEVLGRRADVFCWGRDDAVQVLADVGRLLRAVKCLQRPVGQQGQFLIADTSQEEVDAVGQDAVPYAVSCFEQVLEVPVQLVDVPAVGLASMQDVGLELDAGVVHVEVHPAWVAESWWPFGGHLGGGCHAGDFHEALERVPNVVL